MRSKFRQCSSPAALVLSLLAACGDSTGSGGGGGSATQGYDGTACDECDRTACAAERSACSSEASCAAYLTCLAACSTTSAGDADGACEAGCADAQAPASDVLSAFRTCRTQGPGTTCVACPRDGGEGGSGGGLCTPPDFLEQQCPPNTRDSDCINCQFEACCDSIDTLFNEPGPAADLTVCWLDCNADTQCEADCFDTYPDGVQGFAEYKACTFLHCNEPNGPCPVPPSAGGTCLECTYVECECEYASCHANPECFLALQCFDQCDDAGCVNACQDALPGKNPEYDVHLTCVTQRCNSQCG